MTISNYMPIKWKRLLRVSLECKEIRSVHPKGNQPCVFIGRTDAEAEDPLHGPLMGRAISLEKTLMLGKIEGKRKRGWQIIRLLVNITDSMDMSLIKLREMAKDREAWHAAVHWDTNS